MKNEYGIHKLLTDTPFTLKRIKLGWFRVTTHIYHNNKYFGNVSDKEIARDITFLLNAAHSVGAGSGAAYSSVHVDNIEMLRKEISDSVEYKPYTLEVYKGSEDYDFSIAFEEGTVRSYTGVSRKTLQNTVAALNLAHSVGFKAGIEFGINEHLKKPPEKVIDGTIIYDNNMTP